MSFESYLYEKGLSVATAATYSRCVATLTDWLEVEHLTPESASYRDLLAWLRSLDVKPKSRNLMLTAVRHYMAWLMKEGRRSDNPARGLYIRGERRRLPHDLLTKEQLDELYQSYPASSPAGRRNKVMLGLLVYQAITAGELERLVDDDVDLEGGLITVPGSRTSEGRVLELEGRQVIGLHRYLAEVRPELLNGRVTDRLFVSAGSGAKLNNTRSRLMRQLREQHGFFRDARQLRASRLTLWLLVYGLRETQYMAGHRYVSSTERYRAQDLERLHVALEKHHPLS